MAMSTSNGSSNVSDYKIESYEYFSNVEKISPTPDTIKAYIPKYMPQVRSGNWKQSYPIQIGTIVNAPECRVSLPSVVTEQGYVTLGHYANEKPDFSSKATQFIIGYTKVDEDEEKEPEPIYEYWVMPGNTFMAEVIYEDPTDIKFIGKV